MTAIEKGIIQETFEHSMKVTFEGGETVTLHRPRVSGKSEIIIGYCPETNMELSFKAGELFFRNEGRRYSAKVDEQSRRRLDRFISDVSGVLRLFSRRLSEGNEEVAIYQSPEGLYWVTTFTELDFGYASPRFAEGLLYHLNRVLEVQMGYDEMQAYLNSLLPDSLHGAGPDRPFRATFAQFTEFIQSRMLREAI